MINMSKIAGRVQYKRAAFFLISQCLIKTWLCACVICPSSCHSPAGPEYQAHGCSSCVWFHLVLKNKEEKSQNPFKTKAFISSRFFFVCVCVSNSFQLYALNGGN